MGERATGSDGRLVAVVGIAQAVAAAQTPLDAARSSVDRARIALDGTFAAVSVWEREHGRLRVLVNAGDLVDGEEPLPGDETYPVHDFPEVVEYLHGEWAGGGEPHAWVETADGVEQRPGIRISGSPRCAAAAAAPAWSPRSCCTAGPGGSCMSRGAPASRCSSGRTPTSRPCWRR